MTTERPDRGARALAERLSDLWLTGGTSSDWADAILANGAVFIESVDELERLRRIETAAQRIADDHKNGWEPSIGAMGQLFRALHPEPEGSAQG